MRIYSRQISPEHGWSCWAALSLLIALALSDMAAGGKQLELTLRDRVEAGDAYRVQTRDERWKPEETAIIVCDMWNLHHSRNATHRTAELAPRMNALLKRARSLGVTIVHAPSNCMAYYEDHPARRRVLAIPPVETLPPQINQWCRWLSEEEQAAYPIDQSDGGADDERGAAGDWYNSLKQQGLDPGRPWTRQIETIKIDPERDYITDSGVEHWNLQEHRGIKNVMLLGVHTNMCVLGRPFGLRQMAKNGRNVVLVRDMTDTMYNPRARPFVSHFTGTDLIVEHIEKFVCPTVTSGQILGDGKEFRFNADARKHLVVIAAEDEYQTEESLPQFALKHLGTDFRVSYVHADKEDRDLLHGLDALETADALLVSVRRRGFPKQQLTAIRKFVENGGPVVGIRTASHAFAPRGEIDEGHAAWPEFDREILGGNYQGHHSNKGEDDPATLVQIEAAVAKHPIAADLPMEEFEVGSWLYKTSPLGPNTTLLATGRLEGQNERQPVAWTNMTPHGGKVFYTSLGQPEDFQNPTFQELLRRGVYWAAGLELAGQNAGQKNDAAKAEDAEDTIALMSDAFNLEGCKGEPSLMIPGDLELDLVLKDPLVANPLYLHFDERGRLWVVQYRQYPWPAGLKLVSRDSVWRNVYDPPFAPPPPHAEDSPFRGKDRVTIHEDTDGDGEFDEHKVFLDGLNFCTAALPGRGGVYVLNPPYLLFYADKNRDDVPDDSKPRVLLSGFGIEDSHAVANNLRWGPDGWIYATQGSTVSASVVRHNPDGTVIEDESPIHTMGQNLWRYHPEKHRYEVFAEGGGNAFGVELDDQGHLYSGHNGGGTRGLHYVQGGYYRKNFGKHGSHSNPYVFTHFNNMKHGNVQRFTHTFEIYQAPNLPSRYHNKLFALDPLNNYVILSEISDHGSSRQTRDVSKVVIPGTGEQADWFSPVDIQTGPDGALYIADWYSSQVSHLRNHEGQTHPELGRIYRLRGKNWSFKQPVDLGDRTAAQLVDVCLWHPNRWHRETALRLLGDRKDASVVDELKVLLPRTTGQPALQCLWALNLCGGFTNDVAHTALEHADPDVRRWAVRLIGDAPEVSRAVVDRLIELASEEKEVEVRSQLASTALRLSARDGLPIMQGILAQDRDKHDVHMPGLLWWALEAHADDHEIVLENLEHAPWWTSRVRINGASLPECLIRRWAMSESSEDIDACDQLMEIAPLERRRALAQQFITAFDGRHMPPLPRSLAENLADVKGIFGIILGLRLGDEAAASQALKVIRQQQVPEDEIVQLVNVMGEVRARPLDTVPLLLDLVSAKSPEIQSTAIVALQQFDDERIPKQILAVYPKLTHDVQVVAQSTLASRNTWALELLQAVAAGKFEPKAIEPDTLARCRFHGDAKIDEILGEHFPVTATTDEAFDRRIEQLARVIRSGKGSPAEGRSLYFEKVSCGKCHQLYGAGGEIGPDLTSYNRGDLRRMLLSVVHPSAEVREGYEAYTVITVDGQLFSGFKVREDAKLLILRGIDGKNRTILKKEIDEMSIAPRSLMPDGLLESLTDQELRDLFAFLSSTTPPK